MTAEEREAKLREMQEAAASHRSERETRIARDIAEKQRDREEEERRRQDGSGKIQADFLTTMGQAVYQDKTTASLEDRLRRNKHYVDKGGEERGFLSK
jgi:hypothetical protein